MWLFIEWLVMKILVGVVSGCEFVLVMCVNLSVSVLVFFILVCML